MSPPAEVANIPSAARPVTLPAALIRMLPGPVVCAEIPVKPPVTFDGAPGAAAANGPVVVLPVEMTMLPVVLAI